MDVPAERLDKKLQECSPETVEQVRCQIVEIIELVNRGLLDIVRSRRAEQEVLDLVDERMRSPGLWNSIRAMARRSPEKKADDPTREYFTPFIC